MQLLPLSSRDFEDRIGARTWVLHLLGDSSSRQALLADCSRLYSGVTSRRRRPGASRVSFRRHAFHRSSRGQWYVICGMCRSSTALRAVVPHLCPAVIPSSLVGPVTSPVSLPPSHTSVSLRCLCSLPSLSPFGPLRACLFLLSSLCLCMLVPRAGNPYFFRECEMPC